MDLTKIDVSVYKIVHLLSPRKLRVSSLSLHFYVVSNVTTLILDSLLQSVIFDLFSPDSMKVSRRPASYRGGSVTKVGLF